MTSPVIGVDCRLSGIKHAGIGRYVQAFLQHLPDSQPAQQVAWYFLFANEAQYQELSAVTDQQWFAKQRIQFAAVKHYSLWEQIKLPLILRNQNLALFYTPHFNIPVFSPIPQAVTIHDLLWHHVKGLNVTTLPTWKYHLKHIGYKTVVSAAIRKSRLIVVPSHTVEESINSLFPGSAAKIQVIPEGVDQHLTQSRSALDVTQARSNKLLLYVGSLYPHKNIGVLLKALVKLTDFNLHIVSARNVFTSRTLQAAQQLGIEQRVKFHHQINDDQLKQIMKQTYALIQPSIYEGFGLTGIEAMANEVPVIASDIPIFREIYQNRCLYFDPRSADSLVAAIDSLSSQDDYQQLTRFRVQVTQQFQWQQMTDHIVTSLIDSLRNNNLVSNAPI